MEARPRPREFLALTAGAVPALLLPVIIIGGNPAYSAPADIDFALIARCTSAKFVVQ